MINTYNIVKLLVIKIKIAIRKVSDNFIIK